MSDPIVHRGHCYERLLSWHCSIHDRVCDPFAPVTPAEILELAAKDEALDDGAFRCAVASDARCRVSVRDAEAAVLLSQLRAVPAVTADVEYVDDAGPCDNDYWRDTSVWVCLSHRGVEYVLCADCGLRFVGDTPACDPIDVDVLVPTKAVIEVSV